MNTANYLGFNDWRLPTTSVDSSGINSIGGEMAHLFYNELGGFPGSSILSSADPDLALFQKVQSSGYWSGTENAASPSYGWSFDTSNSQNSNGKYSGLFALAVRPGQVAAVPEPETYAMLLAGLGLLGFTARRRKDLAAHPDSLVLNIVSGLKAQPGMLQAQLLYN